MTKSARISVITASYNQGTFIRDTLESVKRQSHPDTEHLVLDNESSDGTQEVLRLYENQYHLKWWSEPDEGQVDAINKGFERATGDIIAWLNSDDVYFDTKVLARVANYFDRFNADVIYGDLVHINESSTVTTVDIRPHFNSKKLSYRILIGQPAAFIRRSVADAERLNVDLEYGFDYEYWLRLSERRFVFRHVNDVLAGFRNYTGQKSKNQEAIADDLNNVLVEYATDTEGSVWLNEAIAEPARIGRGLLTTYRLYRNPPELAFDGDFAPIHVPIMHLGPRLADVHKALRRLRTGGASG